MEDLIKVVRPKVNARAVVIYSFSEGAHGGNYYDSLSLENARHPQTLLAHEMSWPTSEADFPRKQEGIGLAHLGQNQGTR